MPSYPLEDSITPKRRPAELDSGPGRFLTSRRRDGFHTRELVQHLLSAGGPWTGERRRFRNRQYGALFILHDPVQDDKVWALLVVSLGPQPRAQFDDGDGFLLFELPHHRDFLSELFRLRRAACTSRCAAACISISSVAPK